MDKTICWRQSFLNQNAAICQVKEQARTVKLDASIQFHCCCLKDLMTKGQLGGQRCLPPGPTTQNQYRERQNQLQLLWPLTSTGSPWHGYVYMINKNATKGLLSILTACAMYCMSTPASCPLTSTQHSGVAPSPMHTYTKLKKKSKY